MTRPKGSKNKPKAGDGAPCSPSRPGPKKRRKQSSEDAMRGMVLQREFAGMRKGKKSQEGEGPLFPSSFALPTSSSDLLIPLELLSDVLVCYETLRRLADVLHLAPFSLKCLTQAVAYNERNRLIADVHVALLTCLLEDDRERGVLYVNSSDQQASVDLQLTLLDSMTWPTVLLSYMEAEEDFLYAGMLRKRIEWHYPKGVAYDSRSKTSESFPGPLHLRMAVLSHLCCRVAKTKVAAHVPLREDAVRFFSIGADRAGRRYAFACGHVFALSATSEAVLAYYSQKEQLIQLHNTAVVEPETSLFANLRRMYMTIVTYMESNDWVCGHGGTITSTPTPGSRGHAHRNTPTPRSATLPPPPPLQPGHGDGAEPRTHAAAATTAATTAATAATAALQQRATVADPGVAAATLPGGSAVPGSGLHPRAAVDGNGCPIAMPIGGGRSPSQQMPVGAIPGGPHPGTGISAPPAMYHQRPIMAVDAHTPTTTAQRASNGGGNNVASSGPAPDGAPTLQHLSGLVGREPLPRPQDLSPRPRDLSPRPRDLSPRPRDLSPRPRELLPRPKEGSSARSPSPLTIRPFSAAPFADPVAVAAAAATAAASCWRQAAAAVAPLKTFGAVTSSAITSQSDVGKYARSASGPSPTLHTSLAGSRADRHTQTQDSLHGNHPDDVLAAAKMVGPSPMTTMPSATTMQARPPTQAAAVSSTLKLRGQARGGMATASPRPPPHTSTSARVTSAGARSHAADAAAGRPLLVCGAGADSHAPGMPPQAPGYHGWGVVDPASGLVLIAPAKVKRSASSDATASASDGPFERGSFGAGRFADDTFLGASNTYPTDPTLPSVYVKPKTVLMADALPSMLAIPTVNIPFLIWEASPALHLLGMGAYLTGRFWARVWAPALIQPLVLSIVSDAPEHAAVLSRAAMPARPAPPPPPPPPATASTAAADSSEAAMPTPTTSSMLALPGDEDSEAATSPAAPASGAAPRRKRNRNTRRATDPTLPLGRPPLASFKKYSNGENMAYFLRVLSDRRDDSLASGFIVPAVDVHTVANNIPAMAVTLRTLLCALEAQVPLSLKCSAWLGFRARWMLGVRSAHRHEHLACLIEMLVRSLRPTAFGRHWTRTACSPRWRRVTARDLVAMPTCTCSSSSMDGRQLVAARAPARRREYHRREDDVVAASSSVVDADERSRSADGPAATIPDAESGGGDRGAGQSNLASTSSSSLSDCGSVISVTSSTSMSSLSRQKPHTQFEHQHQRGRRRTADLAKQSSRSSSPTAKGGLPRNFSIKLARMSPRRPLSPQHGVKGDDASDALPSAPTSLPTFTSAVARSGPSAAPQPTADDAPLLCSDTLDTLIGGGGAGGASGESATRSENESAPVKGTWRSPHLAPKPRRREATATPAAAAGKGARQAAGFDQFRGFMYIGPRFPTTRAPVSQACALSGPGRHLPALRRNLDAHLYPDGFPFVVVAEPQPPTPVAIKSGGNVVMVMCGPHLAPTPSRPLSMSSSPCQQQRDGGAPSADASPVTSRRGTSGDGGVSQRHSPSIISAAAMAGILDVSDPAFPPSPSQPMATGPQPPQAQQQQARSPMARVSAFAPVRRNPSASSSAAVAYSPAPAPLVPMTLPMTSASASASSSSSLSSSSLSSPVSSSPTATAASSATSLPVVKVPSKLATSSASANDTVAAVPVSRKSAFSTVAVAGDAPSSHAGVPSVVVKPTAATLTGQQASQPSVAATLPEPDESAAVALAGGLSRPSTANATPLLRTEPSTERDSNAPAADGGDGCTPSETVAPAAPAAAAAATVSSSGDAACGGDLGRVAVWSTEFTWTQKSKRLSTVAHHLTERLLAGSGGGDGSGTPVAHARFYNRTSSRASADQASPVKSGLPSLSLASALPLPNNGTSDDPLVVGGEDTPPLDRQCGVLEPAVAARNVVAPTAGMATMSRSRTASEISISPTISDAGGELPAFGASTTVAPLSVSATLFSVGVAKTKAMPPPPPPTAMTSQAKAAVPASGAPSPMRTASHTAPSSSTATSSLPYSPMTSSTDDGTTGSSAGVSATSPLDPAARIKSDTEDMAQLRHRLFRRYTTKRVATHTIWDLDAASNRRLARRAGTCFVDGFVYHTTPGAGSPPSSRGGDEDGGDVVGDRRHLCCCQNGTASFPQPSISQVWRWRMRHCSSFSSIALQVHMLRACLNWDLFMALPALMAESAVTPGEMPRTVASRRDLDPWGVRSQYFVSPVVTTAAAAASTPNPTVAVAASTPNPTAADPVDTRTDVATQPSGAPADEEVPMEIVDDDDDDDTPVAPRSSVQSFSTGNDPTNLWSNVALATPSSPWQGIAERLAPRLGRCMTNSDIADCRVLSDHHPITLNCCRRRHRRRRRGYGNGGDGDGGGDDDESAGGGVAELPAAGGWVCEQCVNPFAAHLFQFDLVRNESLRLSMQTMPNPLESISVNVLGPKYRLTNPAGGGVVAPQKRLLSPVGGDGRAATPTDGVIAVHTASLSRQHAMPAMPATPDADASPAKVPALVAPGRSADGAIVAVPAAVSGKHVTQDATHAPTAAAAAAAAAPLTSPPLPPSLPPSQRRRKRQPAPSSSPSPPPPPMRPPSLSVGDTSATASGESDTTPATLPNLSCQGAVPQSTPPPPPPPPPLAISYTTNSFAATSSPSLFTHQQQRSRSTLASTTTATAAVAAAAAADPVGSTAAPGARITPALLTAAHETRAGQPLKLPSNLIKIGASGAASATLSASAQAVYLVQPSDSSPAMLVYLPHGFDISTLKIQPSSLGQLMGVTRPYSAGSVAQATTAESSPWATTVYKGTTKRPRAAAFGKATTSTSASASSTPCAGPASSEVSALDSDISSPEKLRIYISSDDDDDAAASARRNMSKKTAPAARGKRKRRLPKSAPPPPASVSAAGADGAPSSPAKRVKPTSGASTSTTAASTPLAMTSAGDTTLSASATSSSSSSSGKAGQHRTVSKLVWSPPSTGTADDVAKPTGSVARSWSDESLVDVVGMSSDDVASPVKQRCTAAAALALSSSVTPVGGSGGSGGGGNTRPDSISPYRAPPTSDMIAASVLPFVPLLTETDDAPVKKTRPSPNTAASKNKKAAKEPAPTADAAPASSAPSGAGTGRSKSPTKPAAAASSAGRVLPAGKTRASSAARASALDSNLQASSSSCDDELRTDDAASRIARKLSLPAAKSAKVVPTVAPLSAAQVPQVPKSVEIPDSIVSDDRPPAKKSKASEPATAASAARLATKPSPAARDGKKSRSAAALSTAQPPLPASSRQSVPTPNRSVPPASKSVPTPSRSVPPASKSVPTPSRSVPPASKSVPTPSRSVPPASKSVPTPSRSVPPASKSVPASSKSVPSTSKSVPEASKSVPSTSKSVPAPSKSVPAPSRSVPSSSESLPAPRKSAPASSKAGRMESEVPSSAVSASSPALTTLERSRNVVDRISGQSKDGAPAALVATLPSAPVVSESSPSTTSRPVQQTAAQAALSAPESTATVATASSAPSNADAAAGSEDEGERSRRASSSTGAGDSSTEDDLEDDSVHCICQRPWSKRRLYLACDVCDSWFHSTCLDIRQADARNLVAFVCATCLTTYQGKRPRGSCRHGAIKTREHEINTRRRHGTPLDAPLRRVKTTEDQYCICRERYDNSRLYIGCEKCSEWFHLECVNLSIDDVTDMSEYVCSGCRSGGDGRRRPQTGERRPATTSSGRVPAAHSPSCHTRTTSGSAATAATAATAAAVSDSASTHSKPSGSAATAAAVSDSASTHSKPGSKPIVAESTSSTLAPISDISNAPRKIPAPAEKASRQPPPPPPAQTPAPAPPAHKPGQSHQAAVAMDTATPPAPHAVTPVATESPSSSSSATSKRKSEEQTEQTSASLSASKRLKRTSASTPAATPKSEAPAGSGLEVTTGNTAVVDGATPVSSRVVASEAGRASSAAGAGRKAPARHLDARQVMASSGPTLRRAPKTDATAAAPLAMATDRSTPMVAVVAASAGQATSSTGQATSSTGQATSSTTSSADTPPRTTGTDSLGLPELVKAPQPLSNAASPGSAGSPQDLKSSKQYWSYEKGVLAAMKAETTRIEQTWELNGEETDGLVAFVAEFTAVPACEVFLEPVDTSLAPDYRDIVDYPMDFSTVSKKLASGQYLYLSDFRHDVSFIFSNCRRYNRKSSALYKDAAFLSRLFGQMLAAWKKKYSRAKDSGEFDSDGNEGMDEEDVDDSAFANE